MKHQAGVKHQAGISYIARGDFALQASCAAALLHHFSILIVAHCVWLQAKGGLQGNLCHRCVALCAIWTFRLEAVYNTLDTVDDWKADWNRLFCLNS
jgi:hypothetical protein